MDGIASSEYSFDPVVTLGANMLFQPVPEPNEEVSIFLFFCFHKRHGSLSLKYKPPSQCAKWGLAVHSISPYRFKGYFLTVQSEFHFQRVELLHVHSILERRKNFFVAKDPLDKEHDEYRSKPMIRQDMAERTRLYVRRRILRESPRSISCTLVREIPIF